MAEGERVPTTTRVRAHRAQLRAQGLRPVQIWVPDVRSPQFAAAVHAQSAAIAASEADTLDQTFVDAISWDWTAEEDGTQTPADGDAAERPE